MVADAIPEPRLRPAVRLAYGLGAAASAIKARGLTVFLMIFYNQVIGLPPDTVAAVLMGALVFDAIIDPLVGQISDNFRSRLGRRHPFMYAAAVPVALAYFALWNPPAAWSHGAITLYLIVCLLTVRLFDTFFELPHNALAPELAEDYVDRTRLFALRTFFGVVGGLGMTVMAYQVFLKEAPDGSGGVLSRDGYLAFSVCSAVLIFAIILISTRGTQSQIPHLRVAPDRSITLKAMLGEVAATLNNRAFVVATLAGMFISIAGGTKSGLELYIGLFFWGLKQSQLAVLASVAAAGSLVGVIIAPHAVRLMGKRYGAISMFSAALVIAASPIALRLFGLMPPNGSTALFVILIIETIIVSALSVGTIVILISMVADVIEDAEVKTGRRSEGLLMSADNLFKKLVSGAGILISGLMLKLAEFPAGAKRGQVDPEIIQRLGVIYLPTAVVLFGLSILCLFAFNIDRAKHEENLSILRDRRNAS